MMKKITIVVIFTTAMCLLNSCIFGGAGMAIFDDSDRKADARMEQVVEAIKTHNKEALEAMFSEKAVNESDDFDSSLNHLLEFVRGEIDSWESTGSYSGSEKIESGHVVKKEVSSFYYVNTGEQRYFFLLKDYPIDVACPENIGFSLMLVVKAEDREKVFDLNQNVDLSHIGIYIPFE